MSNYCWNKVQIQSCSAELFDEIKLYVRGNTPDNDGVLSALDFAKIISLPDLPFNNADESIKWCKDKWGTKWNAFDCNLWRENMLEFYTAYDPPVPVYLELSRIFPSVVFVIEFSEEGGTNGEMKIRKGKMKYYQIEYGEYYFE